MLRISNVRFEIMRNGAESNGHYSKKTIESNNNQKVFLLGFGCCCYFYLCFFFFVCLFIHPSRRRLSARSRRSFYYSRSSALLLPSERSFVLLRIRFLQFILCLPSLPLRFAGVTLLNFDFILSFFRLELYKIIIKKGFTKNEIKTSKTNKK